MAFNKYDSVIDSPGNVFATLDTVAFRSDPKSTISDGNLKSVATQLSSMVISTIGVLSGKWYFECISSGASSQNDGIGFTDLSNTAWYRQAGNKTINGVTTTGVGASWGSNNEVAGVSIDMSTGEVEVFVDGSSQGVIHTLNISEYIYACILNREAGTISVNFGQDHTFAGTKTDSAGFAPHGAAAGTPGRFYYEPPEGALALCSANLPMPIENPKEYFRAVTYTGTGAAQSIDVGFQPDLVWGKNRDYGNYQEWTDSVRGATHSIYSNATNEEETNAEKLKSFDSNGFSIGNAAGYNKSGDKHVAWCWKAGGGGGKYNIDGKPYATFEETGLTAGDIEPIGMSVNTKAGFSIVKYSGNGVDGATVPHGLSQRPDMVIIKNLDATAHWKVWHNVLPTSGTPIDELALNLDGAAAPGNNNFRGIESEVITLGDNIQSNDSNNYIMYCWHSVPGYSSFGTFEGNNSATDGPFVYTGFKPAFVMIKSLAQAKWAIQDNATSPYNPTRNTLYADEDFAAYTGDLHDTDLLDNGFKLRTNDGMFNTNNTYIFMAFAEQPLATQEQKRWKPKLFNIMNKMLFDIEFTAKGAGAGGGTGGAGGAGGLVTATFSSYDFDNSFKIVIGSGGIGHTYQGTTAYGKRLKNVTNNASWSNTGNIINIGAASMQLHDGTIVYGGGGATGYYGGGGAGGGYTGIFRGTTIQQNDAILIAGGGAGGGYTSGYHGGAGGGLTGASSAHTNGGAGGSQIAGGTAGNVSSQNATWSTGQALLGGTPMGGDHGGGGGGGGGYYGGGAGYNGDSPVGNVGGGGGSSFIHINGKNITNSQGAGGAGGSAGNNGTTGSLVITLPEGKTIQLSNQTGTISASASGSVYTITGNGVAVVSIS